MAEYTVPAQIERRRSNFRPGGFGAVAFKFEPNLTVVIKYLPQNVDFCSKIVKCRSNQECPSIFASIWYLVQVSHLLMSASISYRICSDWLIIESCVSFSYNSYSLSYPMPAFSRNSF